MFKNKIDKYLVKVMLYGERYLHCSAVVPPRHICVLVVFMLFHDIRVL